MDASCSCITGSFCVCSISYKCRECKCPSFRSSCYPVGCAKCGQGCICKETSDKCGCCA
ncbi:PREDICTED: metallothionein-2-like [Chrysochloris asiatica]|uniref:Metallothionein n=1 Tax=Chrysochloris asiatica TaxID=185453 RepID=A0A9B0T7Z2_CHRAS|nr:PREDICTED: metallothionein-2-like [Chrysochloris asiatica]